MMRRGVLHRDVSLFIISTLILCASIGTVEGAKKRNARSRRPLISLEGPTDETIEESGLLEQLVSTTTVYEKSKQYHVDTHRRNFSNTVLAYITPWNREGYERAVRFRHKLTHVSPVWYTLKRKEGAKGKERSFVLEGGHEYDAAWIRELKAPSEKGAAPQVVPRFLIDLQRDDMLHLLSNPAEAAAVIMHEMDVRDYDGMVLETWVHWAAIGGLAHDQFKTAAFQFIRFLAHKLHDEPPRRELILAIPPFNPARYNAPYTDFQHWSELVPVVDHWSIMTYDFSSPEEPGANSPIAWLFSQLAGMLSSAQDATTPELASQRMFVLAHKYKMLMGVNFYGYDFNVPRRHSSAITSEGYMNLLSRHQPALTWVEGEVSEHMFEYKEHGSGDLHRVYFPTCASLHLRMRAAHELGVGVSIWELGQGLDRFFDML